MCNIFYSIENKILQMKILVCMTWQSHTDVIRIIWGGGSLNSLRLTVREGPLKKTSLRTKCMNRGCHYEQKRYTTTKTDTQHQNCETQTLKKWGDPSCLGRLRICRNIPYDLTCTSTYILCYLYVQWREQRFNLRGGFVSHTSHRNQIIKFYFCESTLHKFFF